MKKVLLMLTGLLVGILFLSACSSDGDNKISDTGESVKKIGIVQIVEHPSLNSIRESIISRLEEQGFKDGVNVSFDIQNAQGDQAVLKTISQKFVSNHYDLIIAIATPSAQAVAGETSNIPILFAACSDPVAAGLVENLDNPGKNITGTSDVISAEKSMELAKRIIPQIKNLGVLYNASETSSIFVIKELKLYAKKNGINLVEATVTNTAEVQQAALFLVDKVDAIFTPTDNTIASSMPLVSQVAIKARLPLFVGADSMVKDGGLAASGVNYDALGKKTADMAVEILNGKKAGDIPVEVMKDMNIYINKSTAKDIGITIPEDVINEAAQVFGE